MIHKSMIALYSSQRQSKSRTNQAFKILNSKTLKLGQLYHLSKTLNPRFGSDFLKFALPKVPLAISNSITHIPCKSLVKTPRQIETELVYTTYRKALERNCNIQEKVDIASFFNQDPIFKEYFNRLIGTLSQTLTMINSAVDLIEKVGPVDVDVGVRLIRKLCLQSKPQIALKALLLLMPTNPSAYRDPEILHMLAISTRNVHGAKNLEKLFTIGIEPLPETIVLACEWFSVDNRPDLIREFLQKYPIDEDIAAASLCGFIKHDKDITLEIIRNYLNEWNLQLSKRNFKKLVIEAIKFSKIDLALELAKEFEALFNSYDPKIDAHFMKYYAYNQNIEEMNRYWDRIKEDEIPDIALKTLIQYNLARNLSIESVLNYVDENHHETIQLIISVYLLRNNLAEAHKWFERLQDETTRWNTLVDFIKYFAMKGHYGTAEMYLEEFLAPNKLNKSRGFATLIRQSAKNGDMDMVFSYWNRLKSSRALMDARAYGSMIGAMSSKNMHKAALSLFNEFKRTNQRITDALKQTMLVLYGKLGMIQKAETIFKELKESSKTEVDFRYTLNSLMSAYSHSGRFEKALRLFMRMYKSKPMKITNASVSIYIDTCTKSNNINKAEKMFKKLYKEGFVLSENNYCSLIEGYLSIGGKEKAKKLFELMQQRGIKPSKKTLLYYSAGISKIQ